MFLYTFSMDLGALKYTFPMKIVGKNTLFRFMGLTGGGDGCGVGDYFFQKR